MFNYLSSSVGIVSIALSFIFVSACTIHITKLQRDQLEEQADTIASVINFSATHTLKSLQQILAGKDSMRIESDQTKVVLTDSFVGKLHDHGIINAEMLIIDKTEILIEFFYEKSSSVDIPRLLPSWLIIFNYKITGQPMIASIIPVWHSIEDASASNARNDRALHNEFKLLLNQALNKYSLSLNENNGQFR